MRPSIVCAGKRTHGAVCWHTMPLSDTQDLHLRKRRLCWLGSLAHTMASVVLGVFRVLERTRSTENKVEEHNRQRSIIDDSHLGGIKQKRMETECDPVHQLWCGWFKVEVGVCSWCQEWLDEWWQELSLRFYYLYCWASAAPQKNCYLNSSHKPINALILLAGWCPFCKVRLKQFPEVASGVPAELGSVLEKSADWTKIEKLLFYKSSLKVHVWNPA